MIYFANFYSKFSTYLFFPEIGLRRFHEAAKALYRREEIEKDLEFYLGSKWRESVQKHSYLSAVQEYCNHLEKLKNDEPLFVAAHALTQLLAMSSGGVILGKLVRKGFGLNTDKYMTEDGNYLGTESFSLPENGAALKLELKNSAEALGKCMNESEQHRFMDEHCRVFELNNAWISQYPVGIISPVIGMAKVTIGPRIMIAGAAFGTVLLARYAYLKFKDT